MTAKEKYELIERLTHLPVAEQLELIEALVRGLRKASADTEAIGKAMDALVDEPGLNAPYPIPEGLYTEDQLRPRGQR